MTTALQVASALDRMLVEILQSLELAPEAAGRLRVTGEEALPSCFPVTELAVASVGAAGLATAELLRLDGRSPPVTVDRHLASAWFLRSLAPVGWTLRDPWDPIAGDYRAADGWIRLHTNAPHHRAVALSVLGCAGDRDAVAGAVAHRARDELEAAILQGGGCAAAMHSMADWQGHEQGRAIMAEPLIAWERRGKGAGRQWQPEPLRPLTGIKVLDLTRVLAGPVATRFLAGLGADVLRIDPPGWSEPAVVPDVTLGKRCARLDLREPGDRRVFEALLAGADMMVHGYRPGALERLGYDAARRRALNAGLIDVSLCAYGWSGPWAGRRGFDSLVQMSCGIAEAGMRWKAADRPVPLPVQALDHATGYLMAAAAIRGLAHRMDKGGAVSAKLSLARTAALLGGRGDAAPAAPVELRDTDYAPGIERTPWGPARRLRSPVLIGTLTPHWDRPASELGAANASW
ncbi:CoA transferase [Muricoccus aerilatus]|uniref:CoA transferase n=1 Tax=Muricoccus aerilatus TaxID=452982 RepID=UPI0005C2282C|nr:CoA transferase [Roseomonas aerilata]